MTTVKAKSTLWIQEVTEDHVRVRTFQGKPIEFLFTRREIADMRNALERARRAKAPRARARRFKRGEYVCVKKEHPLAGAFGTIIAVAPAHATVAFAKPIGKAIDGYQNIHIWHFAANALERVL